VVTTLLDDIQFILARLDWLSLLDILLVTFIIFSILILLRGTQAQTLLRGVLSLIVLVVVLSSFEVLPAFSWLVNVTLPAILLSIPVIFAPEIRRALERLGRASAFFASGRTAESIEDVIQIIVSSVVQLADRRHGALIVMQRMDGLEEYIETGVTINSDLNDKMLLQIFYPNTPMHDGAVILSGNVIVAASCVMPLAQGDIQAHSSGRRMGLRHRAAIGTSEASDAVVVVVSEETGMISVAYGGRMIRRLDAARLENILTNFYRPLKPKKGLEGWLERLFQPKEV
jgi:diadenylate cyclase